MIDICKSIKSSCQDDRYLSLYLVKEVYANPRDGVRSAISCGFSDGGDVGFHSHGLEKCPTQQDRQLDGQGECDQQNHMKPGDLRHLKILYIQKNHPNTNVLGKKRTGKQINVIFRQSVNGDEKDLIIPDGHDEWDSKHPDAKLTDGIE